MKKTVMTALKLIFVGVVFYFLWQKKLISIDALGRAMSQTNHLIPGVLAAVFTLFLAGLRWQWLLQAQDIHIKWTRTLQLVFIGQFFNIALPGAISGDFVKAFYAAEESKVDRGRAFGSILFDRIVGLSALVLVAGGALLSHFRAFVGTPLFSGIKVFVSVATLCVFVFYTYLFLVKEAHDPVFRVLDFLEAKSAKFGTLKRIYVGTRHYHHHRLLVLKALSVSIVIQLLVGFACIQFAYALGETQLVPLAMYVVVPLGILVTAIPVLPGGVGTGHAAFSWFFQLIGSQRGADVFSFQVLCQFLLGAIGGLVYLRFKSGKVEIPAA